MKALFPATPSSSSAPYAVPPPPPATPSSSSARYVAPPPVPPSSSSFAGYVPYSEPAPVIPSSSSFASYVPYSEPAPASSSFQSNIIKIGSSSSSSNKLAPAEYNKQEEEVNIKTILQERQQQPREQRIIVQQATAGPSINNSVKQVLLEQQVKQAIDEQLGQRQEQEQEQQQQQQQQEQEHQSRIQKPAPYNPELSFAGNILDTIAYDIQKIAQFIANLLE
jgi:hypothetical protein